MTILNLTRKILGVKVTLSKQDAVAKAKTIYQENGWAWGEPIRIIEGIHSIQVFTNTNIIGRRMVELSVVDGRILRRSRTPR